MKNAKGNRSKKWRVRNHTSIVDGITKVHHIGVTYDWRSMMDAREEDIHLGIVPNFFYKGHYTIEDWTLEKIRRKYFIELRDAKDYERDRWMPKAVTLIHYILEREVVNLYDLSTFLGMPRRYLASLARRDKPFRNWIIHTRNKNIETRKAPDADTSRSLGTKSLLDRLNERTHFTTSGRANPYPDPIDVGWRRRSVSHKR